MREAVLCVCPAILRAFPIDMNEPPITAAEAHRRAEAELFAALSEFQQDHANAAPVAPDLVAVLAAAAPAFKAGFSYSSAFFAGELTVTLHYLESMDYGSAEIGSSAPAPLDSYSATAARLLAGLLGIPLTEVDAAREPEVGTPVRRVTPAELQQQEPAAAPAPEPEPVPAPAPAQEPEPEPAASADSSSAPLSDDEKATAVQMVKAISDPAKRKEFQKAFRLAFNVPATEKTIVPLITEQRHLEFIDRYTVEAAGGIAP